MLKAKVLLKPDRLLIYITRALPDILKAFYLILRKVCTSISNISSGQHRCRHLPAHTQITSTCAVSVTCSRYLRFIFTWRAVDLCMHAGQLSGQPSFDLHCCTSRQVASYPEIPDVRPNSCFSVWTKFRGWGQERTCMERIKICNTQLFITKRIPLPLTTTILFVSKFLLSSQDTAWGNGKGSAEQHC